MWNNQIVEWLLEGDISIQYQVYRDLLQTIRPDLQKRIEKEGWGAQFLAARNRDGEWGEGFFDPGWTCTHYTLLDLKNLSLSSHQPEIRKVISGVLSKEKRKDGGINPQKRTVQSDVCLNGMFLNYAAYFGADKKELRSVIDFLISQQMPDGGFNGRRNRGGALHSSLHSTLSVLEGILEYRQNGYNYRINDLRRIEEEAREFLLDRHLFRSHTTGEIIDLRMLRLVYPCRWRYDILRVLDYFKFAGTKFDHRMTDALDILLRKKRPDKKWVLQAQYPGKTHFKMEEVRQPSRWNTLRTMRVLLHFGIIP